jgi:hypothetical protein
MLARAPFVSVVLCFISGILLADWLMSFLDISQFVCIGLAVSSGVISFIFYFKNSKTAFGVSFSLFLLMLATYCKVSVEEKRNGEINSLQNTTVLGLRSGDQEFAGKTSPFVAFGSNRHPYFV